MTEAALRNEKSHPPESSAVDLAREEIATVEELNMAEAEAALAVALPVLTATLPVPAGRGRTRVTRIARREPIRRPAAKPVATEPETAAEKLEAETRKAEKAAEERQAELRDWIKNNAALLSNASLLISLTAVALNLLPDVGVFSPYIKALLFAGALLLLLEMHHQWPADLQLRLLRPGVATEKHSWRMICFALVMQIATIVFALWATLTNPIILLPLTALGVFFAFYRWYFRRFNGLLARIFGIVALVAVLLISEVLMVIVWAGITGQHVTLDFWSNDQPGVSLNVWDAD